MMPSLQRRVAVPIALVAAAILVAAGCVPAATDEVAPMEPQIVRSSVERMAAPPIDETDLSQLVLGNQHFAFDLYQAIRSDRGNLFCSPYSVSIALAMTYAGARTQTENEMADVLRFNLDQDHLHPAFNALDHSLAAQEDYIYDPAGQPFRLSIANALWGQTGYGFLPSYLDLLAANYGAGLGLLGFASDPEASRLTINDWISKETEQRIQDLLAPQTVTTETLLVLTNAIYFNAAWLEPFEESLTHDAPFHQLDGTAADVPMMRQTTFFRYADGPDFQAAELPYLNSAMAMVVLLPDSDRFSQFEASLTAERYNEIIDALSTENVALELPRFTYESDVLLGATLAGMGMPTAFRGGDADFSGMDGSRRLFIGEVIHKAFVAVDEKGTEAAAATAIVMLGMGAPQEPVRMTVDRPFLFVIRDRETGTILFLGRVLDPRGD